MPDKKSSQKEANKFQDYKCAGGFTTKTDFFLLTLKSLIGRLYKGH